jgi:protein SCO1/2
MKTKLFLALALVAVGTTSAPALEFTTNRVVRSCCAQSEEAEQASDKSIYQVESRWKTDADKEIQLSALAGKPQVVLMFFANCNYACPILLNDMRRIEAALPEGLCTNVSFTLISFDTKRDTPKALALFRQAQGLAADHWNLLSGSDDDILELAALLGVRYKQDATGQFMHSNLITILNAKGEVVHQQIGLNQDVAETVRTLKQLMTP